MARRNKYEFLPDRSGTSIWSRLYLTKKQRLSILKWTLYSLTVLLCLLLQDVLLYRVSIFGATTDLVPCCIFLVCLLEGSENGSIFALSASAFFLFSGSSPGYHAMVIITFLSIAVAIFRQTYLRSGFSTAIICAAIAGTLYELIIFTVGSFLGTINPARLGTALITAALTALVSPILYPVILSIGKIGGEAWKE